MANLIELAKSYVPMLDEVYKLASCTSDLDGAPELARQGANANELIIPMLEMDGLADYDRNGGYVAGDVKMENRTVQCNFDRGRMFTVDTMDNAETAGLAFGRLAAEFIRTKVVPELDAFRFACYAGKPGISSAEATLSSGADVIAAISAAVTEMDENEVPSDQRHLRITSTLLRAIKDMDSYKSREVLESFASVKPVPQRRFYTAIEQLSGKDGEKAGGFRKYGKHYVKCAQGDTGALEVILDSGSVSGAQIKAAARCRSCIQALRRRLCQGCGRRGDQLHDSPYSGAYPVPEACGAEDHFPGAEPDRGRLEVRVPQRRHRGRLRK